MADTPDQDKFQKDLMDTVRRMVAQQPKEKDPAAERVEEEREERQKEQRKSILNFHMKPKEVKKHLDRFVIKQEQAKRVLATAVCDHYNYVRAYEEGGKSENYLKQNVVMLGPTGVGKTYLIRRLADLIGVPFVKADATKFSETGYVGADVDDLVRELVHKAEGDVELAKFGMVYIDEVDKIASPNNMQGRDVSGTGVQRGLLKLMEETEVPLRAPNDIQSQIQAMAEYQQKGKLSRPMINTRHILFIVSGAFEGLKPIISKRLRDRQLGFAAAQGANRAEEDLLCESRTHDFIDFGFEPEFIGRLPVRVSFDSLHAEDLYQILTSSEGSIVRQYEESFRAYGIAVKFDDKALWEIAKRAEQEKTGARGLATVCERALRDIKYELPSSRLTGFTLTEGMVSEPEEGVRVLLQEELREESSATLEAARGYEKRFLEKNSIAIRFSESACIALQEKIFREGLEAEKFFDQWFANYGYGLGLIHKKAPRSEYLLTEENVKEPNIVLDRWVKESYEG